MTEREAATVKTLEAGPALVRVSLTCPADPALYDLPLTLSTQVPATWAGCVVKQGARESKATAAGGVVQYQAVPGADAVSLRPVCAK